MKGSSFQRIIVLSLAGFGDALMATPLCQLLRRIYPDAWLEALVMFPTSGAAYRSLGVFDRVVTHNFFTSPYLQSLQQLTQLRKQKFDLALLTYPANRPHYNAVARVIGAKTRIGHNYSKGGNLRNLRFLLTHRVAYQHYTHNVYQNLALAKALGLNEPAPRLSVGNLGADQAASAKAEVADRPKPLVGMHLGCCSMKNQHRRRWPADRFAELAVKVRDRLGGTPLAFAGNEELELLSTVREQAPQTIPVANRPIEQTTALIRQCDCFVTSDSGLGHLAAACDVPVVDIFGPTDPTFTAPWGVPHRIV